MAFVLSAAGAGADADAGAAALAAAGPPAGSARHPASSGSNTTIARARSITARDS